MMAVLQTGSRAFRAACATKRRVCRLFWAWTDGAPRVMAAAAAAPRRTICRRLMRSILELPPSCGCDSAARGARADGGPGGIRSFKQPKAFPRQRSSRLFKTIACRRTAVYSGCSHYEVRLLRPGMSVVGTTRKRLAARIDSANWGEADSNAAAR